MTQTRKRPGPTIPGTNNEPTPNSKSGHNPNLWAGQSATAALPKPPTAKLAELADLTTCPPPPSVRSWLELDEDEYLRIVKARQSSEVSPRSPICPITDKAMRRRNRETMRFAALGQARKVAKANEKFRSDAPRSNCFRTKVVDRVNGSRFDRDIKPMPCQGWKCRHCSVRLMAAEVDKMLDRLGTTSTVYVAELNVSEAERIGEAAKKRRQRRKAQGLDPLDHDVRVNIPISEETRLVVSGCNFEGGELVSLSDAAGTMQRATKRRQLLSLRAPRKTRISWSFAADVPAKPDRESLDPDQAGQQPEWETAGIGLDAWNEDVVFEIASNLGLSARKRKDGALRLSGRVDQLPDLDKALRARIGFRAQSELRNRRNERAAIRQIEDQEAAR